MALVVVGGHSRSIGKTSVVAALIARLSDLRWTAFKITQYGHGFCTADGAPCDCQTDDHSLAISEERNAATGTDSARYLAAGAERSLWVRARQGNLAAAMPRVRRELASAQNAILESNSILQFLKPDLYLSVLDHGTADFKDSARLYLDRADAILLRRDTEALTPRWQGVSRRLYHDAPVFAIAPPEYLSSVIADFVRARVIAANARPPSLL